MMRKNREAPVYAPLFVLFSSLIFSAIVGIATVKAIGYSVAAGLLYFFGYAVAMILFFEACGFSLFRRKYE